MRSPACAPATERSRGPLGRRGSSGARGPRAAGQERIGRSSGALARRGPRAGASLWLVAVGLWALPPTRAGELVLAPPPGQAGVEVEVLPWAGGERARALARLVAPAHAHLPAGEYALRVAGSDHRLGPLRMGEAGAHLRLGAVRAVGPRGAPPAAWFLLDPTTGAAAARVLAGGPAAAILPGRYALRRDLSAPEAETQLEVPPGAEVAIEFGAVTFQAPGVVRDVGLFVVAAEDVRQVHAFARLHDGPVELRPGRYRALREGSGVLSPPFEVAPGVVTSLTCASLALLPLGGGSPEALVQGAGEPTGPPLLRALAGLPGELIWPGDYVLTTWARALAADRAEAPPDPAWLRRTVRPGDAVKVWVSAAGVHADGEGALRVSVTAESRRVPAGRSVSVRVAIPAPCELELIVVTAHGEATPLARRSVAASPPVAVVELDLARDQVAEGERPLVVEAAAGLPSGPVRGRSAPFLVVSPRVGPVERVAVVARATTWIELAWAPVAGAAGYRVYRVGAARPIHGSTALPGASFRDLGLLAGRALDYEVCAVDPAGHEGPRATVRATTEAP